MTPPTITPILGEPDRFEVASSRAGNPPHLVDRAYTDPDTGVTGWACSCPDHMARGRQCKHIRAVQAFLASAGQCWNCERPAGSNGNCPVCVRLGRPAGPPIVSRPHGRHLPLIKE